MTIFKTFSLGCRVNQAELETITENLESSGYSCDQESHHPDFILLNTCVVTQKAEKETRKEIRKLKRLYPKSKLIVLGCAVDAKEKLSSKLPDADYFVSNQNKSEVVKIIFKLFSTKQQLTATHFSDKYQKSGKALIKIQDGCNYLCSYCIVPFLRGRSSSKSPEKIINQINKLKDTQEIILTGVNLSLYGQDLKPKISFLDLLKSILSETAIKKISLTSLDPQLVDRKLVDLYIRNKRLSRNLHFSLQSGSRRVLKRMNRNPDLEKFKKLLQELRNNDPKFIFSADIIVGFPNETEKEFKETVLLIKQIKLNRAHLFRFSTRPGTIAFQNIQNNQWEDLSLEVKKERERIIDSFLPED
jgi:threonylcarbamoyladenosine tRNA methylthiotransferase MtaB